MKLYNFLNETKYFKDLKLEECIKIIEQNCSKNWKYYKSSNFEGIWRGDYNGPKNIGVFEGKTTRKSANTSNHYTILFSELLPSWNHLPKRNKSIICSLENSIAEQFGKLYFVLPYDNTNIGCTNVEDIWEIIEYKPEFRFIEKLDEFNDLFDNLFDDFNLSSNKLKSIVNMTIDNFMDEYKTHYNIIFWLMLFDLKIDEDASDEEISKCLENVKKKYKGVKLLDFLDKILNSKKLNIENKKYEQLKTKNIEVWTDGPALLISENTFYKLEKTI